MGFRLAPLPLILDDLDASLFKVIKITRQIFRKRWQIRQWGQWKSNRKPAMGYRLAPWPLTLNDLEPSYIKVIKLTVRYFDNSVWNAPAWGRYTFHRTYFLFLLIITRIWLSCKTDTVCDWMKCLTTSVFSYTPSTQAGLNPRNRL